MADLIVIGDWTGIYSGFCVEFEHRYNKRCAIKYPSSVLHDLDSFADLLQQNPAKSLQLTSKDKVTLEDFFYLLTVIGDNCKGLECLAINLNMDDCEEEIHKSIVDLDLEDVNDLEPLTLPQRTCVQAWSTLIDSMAPTFQHIHISIVADCLSIPYFASQMIVNNCPHYSCIGDQRSASTTSCIVYTKDELGEVIEHGTDYVVCLHAIYSDFDLSSISGKFNNLRRLYFECNSSINLAGLEEPAMMNLSELSIHNNISEDSDSSLTLIVPTVDLFLPENSTVTDLTVSGLDLTQTSWDKLGERAKLLKCIYISRGGTFQSEYIEICALNLPRLETLHIEAPNNLTANDIIPFLKLSEENTIFERSLDVWKNNICSNDDIEETVVQILECLENITDESVEGKVWVDIEYCYHVGGFEFLKEIVENHGFTFERGRDDGSEIWNFYLSNRTSSSRLITLREGKGKPKYEGESQG